MIRAAFTSFGDEARQLQEPGELGAVSSLEMRRGPSQTSESFAVMASVSPLSLEVTQRVGVGVSQCGVCGQVMGGRFVSRSFSQDPRKLSRAFGCALGISPTCFT
jgi:hypothetical protein